MATRILPDNSLRADTVRHDGTREVAPDVAYQRLAIANMVYYGTPGAGDGEWVLIDGGVMGTDKLLAEAVRNRFGAGARPAAIILTHGHFDHVGNLEHLAAQWGVPIYAHDLELPYLTGRAGYPPPDPEIDGGLMATFSRFYPMGPVDVGRWLRPLPADGTVPGMAGWRWFHTPGHTPGHISLWREADRLLIAGDAFITTAQESAYATAMHRCELHGPPMYYTQDWEKAEDSVLQRARLEPEVVVTGHGPAMRGPRMRSALHALASNFRQMAVPQRGRYVWRPARAEDGTAYVAVKRAMEPVAVGPRWDVGL